MAIKQLVKLLTPKSYVRLHLSHVVMLYSKQVAMLGEKESSLSYEFVAL